MDQTIKKINSLCSVSTRMTAQTYFPERFYMPCGLWVAGHPTITTCTSFPASSIRFIMS